MKLSKVLRGCPSSRWTWEMAAPGKAFSTMDFHHLGPGCLSSKSLTQNWGRATCIHHIIPKCQFNQASWIGRWSKRRISRTSILITCRPCPTKIPLRLALNTMWSPINSAILKICQIEQAWRIEDHLTSTSTALPPSTSKIHQWRRWLAWGSLQIHSATHQKLRMSSTTYPTERRTQPWKITSRKASISLSHLHRLWKDMKWIIILAASTSKINKIMQLIK